MGHNRLGSLTSQLRTEQQEEDGGDEKSQPYQILKNIEETCG